MILALAAFCVFAVASFALTRWMVQRPFGWGLDLPDEARKHHPRPVPRTGGLPLWVTFVWMGR
ncbi:MAG: hypothetical protein SNJ84_08900, partial [Verrucomicrobiia bacterium]